MKLKWIMLLHLYQVQMETPIPNRWVCAKLKQWLRLQAWERSESESGNNESKLEEQHSQRVREWAKCSIFQPLVKLHGLAPKEQAICPWRSIGLKLECSLRSERLLHRMCSFQACDIALHQMTGHIEFPKHQPVLSEFHFKLS